MSDFIVMVPIFALMLLSKHEAVRANAIQGLLPGTDILQRLAGFCNSTHIKRGQNRTFAKRCDFNEQLLGLDQFLDEGHHTAAHEDRSVVGRDPPGGSFGGPLVEPGEHPC